MSARLVETVDLERHARQLRRALRVSCPVALCDESGSALWLSDDPQRRLAAALSKAAREELAPAGASGRWSSGKDQSLVWVEVVPAHGLQTYLVVLLDGPAERFEGEVVETTLADAAAGITSELRLGHEVDNLASELAERYEELNVVYSFERHIGGADEEALGAVNLLRSLAGFLQLDLAAIVYRSGDKPVYATAPNASIPNLDLVLTAFAGDVLRFVTAARQPLVLNTSDDPRRQYLFANLPYRLIATPIFLDGRIQAVMVLMRSVEVTEFTNGDRSLSEVIARQVGVLLSSRSAVSALTGFSEQMAAALIEAIEAKDPYTRGHSERVQQLAIQLAAAAELGVEDIDAVSWGALLHDVGKIGIPDAILCKAGRLSKDEFTMIKIHPERGFEILGHIEALNGTTRDAVRYHHEKFDGRGYPHRLKGLAIPIHARVISVADTYDAVTSSRSYRPGRSHDDAMGVLAEAAGSQLDPRLVQIFERMSAAGEVTSEKLPHESSDV